MGGIKPHAVELTLTRSHGLGDTGRGQEVAEALAREPLCQLGEGRRGAGVEILARAAHDSGDGPGGRLPGELRGESFDRLVDHWIRQL